MQADIETGRRMMHDEYQPSQPQFKALQGKVYHRHFKFQEAFIAQLTTKKCICMVFTFNFISFLYRSGKSLLYVTI